MPAVSEPTACVACGVVKPPCCYEHGYREKGMCRPCASQKNKRTRDRAKASPAGIARQKRAKAKLIERNSDAYAAKVAEWAERRGIA